MMTMMLTARMGRALMDILRTLRVPRWGRGKLPTPSHKKSNSVHYRQGRERGLNGAGSRRGQLSTDQIHATNLS